MKKSLEIPQAKKNIRLEQRHMLEELVRKYEEHRDNKDDNDLNLQRFSDIFPATFGAGGHGRVSDVRAMMGETTKTTMGDKKKGARQET